MTEVTIPAVPAVRRLTSSIANLPGKLPSNDLPSRTLDCTRIASDVLATLIDEPCFTSDALFRDQFALTGTLRTIYGKHVLPTWKHLAQQRQVTDLKLVDDSASLVALGPQTAWIEARITFKTRAGGLPQLCSGFIWIVPGQGDAYELWSLQTLLEELEGHEMVDLRERYPLKDITKGGNGVANGVNATSSPQASIQDSATTVVDTIVVGGGQHGLSCGSYCKAFGLDYVIIERNAHVGDNWVLRYESLYLHTPHRFNDLAFGPTFNNEEHSEWLTSKDLARGYQSHVQRFGINIWLSSNITSCTYDDAKERWTMTVDVNGEMRTLVGRDLVLCTGPGGTNPLMPSIPDREKFKGTVMHSRDWKSAKEFAGGRGIVIGSANSAHDVAENMEGGGMHTTMVQRNPTYVIPRPYMSDLLNAVWRDGRSQDLSDRAFWSPPVSVARDMCTGFFAPLYQRDAARYEELNSKGFMNDPQACFMDHLLVRFGGHALDHGATDKILEGAIKVKSDSPIDRFTEHGLQFKDGSVIPADVVVYATGFEKDTSIAATSIIGAKLASQLDTFFGVDEEGEVKGAFKPCGVPHLYMSGGGCAHARYFPRFIALQSLANKLGSPLPLFKGVIEP